MWRSVSHCARLPGREAVPRRPLTVPLQLVSGSAWAPFSELGSMPRERPGRSWCGLLLQPPGSSARPRRVPCWVRRGAPATSRASPRHPLSGWRVMAWHFPPELRLQAHGQLRVQSPLLPAQLRITPARLTASSPLPQACHTSKR